VTREAASLAIIGCYPPPHGGVANEVKRLCPLMAERGIDYVVYNAVSDAEDGDRVISVARRRRTWMLRYLFEAKEPVIYLLSPRLASWIIGALMSVLRGKHVLVQLRNAMLPDWIAHSWWRRMIAGLALRRMTGVICVSRLLMEAARTVGVDAKRLHWNPAFLPPEQSEMDPHNVAPQVWSFMEAHRPLVAANGKVNWYAGQDLYGLDHLVELTARLKPDYPNIGVVVCFWNHEPGDQKYLDELSRSAADKGVGENILFNTKNGLFVPVLAGSDVFVRPTNTDGDAVSVREALYLGVPALASDAVERPEGTVVFRTRDVEDLESKVRLALASGVVGAEQQGERRFCAEDGKRINSYLELLAALADAPGSKRSTP